MKETDAHLDALERIAHCDGATAEDWNALGSARAQRGENEEALAAFREAAHIKPQWAVCHYNIGLMHEQCGRCLDAYHSFRHSFNVDNEYALAAKRIPVLATILKKYAALKIFQPAEKLRIEPEGDARFAQPPPVAMRVKEVGANDYVNPYLLLNVLPAGQIPTGKNWFEQPEDWEQRVGPVTRRRRELTAEVDLNEGRISWLPRLRISDNVVHGAMMELDDRGWNPYHWCVFGMPLLNRFLVYGDLDYFRSTEHAPYPLCAEIAGAGPDDPSQKKFTAFLSPFFRAQWEPAIKMALGAEDYAGACALFATSLPLTVTDFDQAVEPLRRHFGNRLEVLKQLHSSVQAGRTAVRQPELAIAEDEAKLLNLVPIQLSGQLRDDMCMAYRGIAIALANTMADYETAKQALVCAANFQAAANIRLQLDKDQGKLAELKEANIQTARAGTPVVATPRPQQSSSEGKIGCAIMVGLIGVVLIFNFNSNDRLPVSGSFVSSSVTKPPAATGLTSPAPPQIYSAPLTSNSNDQTIYRVPTYLNRELEKDKAEIEVEKNKVAAMELRLSGVKQAVDVQKARTEQLEKQLAALSAQLNQARKSIDETSQARIDNFNRKVGTYNAMLANVRAETQRLNQVVDRYNAIIEEIRTQNIIINQKVDAYNTKLKMHGR